MCEGDDHLAWKHPVSLEACRGLRTNRGVILVRSLDSPSWTRVRAPIQTSEDAHARMDRLEQRMRQMRVSDGAISWDDFDGALVANLPSHFRMPEIKRYTGIEDRDLEIWVLSVQQDRDLLGVIRHLGRLQEPITHNVMFTPRPVPQPVPPQFRMDLHRAYHQSLGHDTNRCLALRHAIQDFIDQGLVNLGQPSVTTNPLLAHSTHAVDTVGSQTSTPFSLISDWVPFELTPTAPSITTRQGPSIPFILWPDNDDLEGRDVQIVTHSGRVGQPPPLVVSHLMIRMETTTTLEGLIHMMTADRATCIMFSNDDLPPKDSNHTRPLYITVGCSGHRVPSVLLKNGSTLNVYPLATAIALSYAPSDFGLSTRTVRAYDSTKSEVMGTLMIELLIGPTTYPKLFQVLRIPTSFNLLLRQPWIEDMFASSESMLQISHSEDDLFFTEFTFDEILGLGRCQHRPMEFVATVDHDTPFGLGFVPIEANYRLLHHRIRGSSSYGDFSIVTNIEGLGNETFGAPISMMIAPSSPDRASFLSLCFPDETIDYRIGEMVQPEPTSSFDLFRIVLSLELMEDVTIGDDEFEDTFGFIEGASGSLYSPAPFAYLTTSNVVPIPKKDGKVRVCVDFKNLNKASPKDDFPLPYIDLLVDSTMGHSMLRLNPKKCTFGVTSRKLLGHMASEWGIEVDLDKIKAILDMPMPRIKKETRDMALGCMLAQLDDSRRERAIYYLSKRMLEYEMRYVMIERLYLALVWATRRLRYYLTEYSYVSQKSIKESIVADHLASLPISKGKPLMIWHIDFDGATNQSGFGIGVSLISPQVEYEACILGLETALDDSNLVLRQIQDRASADRVMREVHAGVCGPHMEGHMLARATPYSLMYGMEVILPVETEMSSLKVALER
ncbi:hypothetical protein AAG906_024578 [Vitis piasezkii]